MSLSSTAPIWFEGPVLGFMHMIRAGRLYQISALGSAPFSALTHTPLSYLLDYAAWSVVPDVRTLRLVNILVTLGCALLVGRLTRLEAGNRAASLFAMCVFLGASPVLFWSQVARCPDALCCLFSLGALTALLSMRASLSREIATGVLLALAILSKQTAIVILTPALVAHAAFVERRYRPLLLRVVFSASILIPVFLYLQWATGGGFLANVIGANLNRMGFDWWKGINVRLLGFWLLCVALAITGGVRKSIVSVWFLASLAFGLIGTAKRGADTMYYFDTAAALAVLLGTSAAARPRLGRILLAAALVPGTLATLRFDHLRYWDFKGKLHGSRQYREMIAWLRDHGATPDKMVLADDAGVSIALGEQPVWDDPFVFTEWAEMGRWSDAEIAANVRRNAYCAIVVSAPRLLWPAHLKREIVANYTLAKVFPEISPDRNRRCVYLPKAEIASGLPGLEPLQIPARTPACSILPDDPAPPAPALPAGGR